MSDNPHSLSERSHPYLPGLWLAAGFLGLASVALLLRIVTGKQIGRAHV